MRAFLENYQKYNSPNEAIEKRRDDKVRLLKNFMTVIFKKFCLNLMMTMRCLSIVKKMQEGN
jgi:hypothetical protein